MGALCRVMWGSEPTHQTLLGIISIHIHDQRATGAASSTDPAGSASITEALDKLAGLLQARVEVNVPVLTMHEILGRWTPPADEKLRNQCPPIPEAKDFDKLNLEEFNTFLKTNTKLRREKSRKSAMLNTKRFMALVNVPPDSDLVGIMVALQLCC